jgi:hypothetical protein
LRVALLVPIRVGILVPIRIVVPIVVLVALWLRVNLPVLVCFRIALPLLVTARTPRPGHRRGAATRAVRRPDGPFLSMEIPMIRRLSYAARCLAAWFVVAFVSALALLSLAFGDPSPGPHDPYSGDPA